MIQVNIALLVVLFLVSRIIDYLIQTSWEAENKGKRVIPLLVHSFIYSFLSSAITFFLLSLDFCQVSTVFVVLFLTHIFIDSRLPVKWWMRSIKGMKGDLDKEHLDVRTAVDQRFHELVILILALFIH